MAVRPIPPHATSWRFRLHQIVFEADTPAGKAFDVIVIAAILMSVLVVMLDSVADIHATHGDLLLRLEWMFTILFTVEYIVRLICVGSPVHYARSFFGIVDLLSIIPTYLSVFVTGAQSLLVIRALRLIRIFRVLKLRYHLSEMEVLSEALRASRHKIVVFLTVVLSMAVVVSAMVYLIEGEASGFTSIPRAMYWAIVTMTTVGYGDITPQTVPGQIAASGLMILGYAILAVPTGIVSVELAQATWHHRVSTQACLHCGAEGHDFDASHCKYCGTALEPDPLHPSERRRS